MADFDWFGSVLQILLAYRSFECVRSVWLVLVRSSVFNGFEWFLKVFNCFWLLLMVCNGFQCFLPVLMVFNGFQWFFIVCHVFSLFSIVFNGFQCFLNVLNVFDGF